MSEPNLDPMYLFRRAWEVFQTRSGLLIGMTLLLAVVTGANTSGSSSGDEGFDLGRLLVGVALGIAVFLIRAVISGPLKGGYDLAVVRIVRGDQTVEASDFFVGFQRFVSLGIIGLIVSIVTGVGFLFFIVPGFVLWLGLWPCYLLAMEDGLEPVDALKAAWRLTDGHKLALFILSLASLGLVLAGLLALLVGVFVAAPVVQLAWILAYEELRRVAGAAPQLVVGSDPAPAQG